MSTARMNFRLDKELKEKIEKASALTGAKSTTEYFINVMKKEATKDINRHAGITLQNDIFDCFTEACEKAESPNKALLNAAKYTKNQGIR